MTEKKGRYPTFGEVIPSRICSISLKRDGVDMCDRPASHHIFWYVKPNKLIETSFVCKDHVRILLKYTDYVAYHEMDSNCGMPMTHWKMPENICIFDGGASLYTERHAELELVTS